MAKRGGFKKKTKEPQFGRLPEFKGRLPATNEVKGKKKGGMK